jgi:copper ion binding protein
MASSASGKGEQVVITVEGMSCMHCVGRVESGLKETAGVLDAKVSLEEKKAEVSYDPEKITADGIREKIVEIGYQAT